jgi:hypothetical protein
MFLSRKIVTIIVFFWSNAALYVEAHTILGTNRKHFGDLIPSRDFLILYILSIVTSVSSMVVLLYRRYQNETTCF